MTETYELFALKYAFHDRPAAANFVFPPVGADGDLHEAQLRGVGLLPEELRVERAAPGGPSSAGDLVDAGGVDDHTRELAHVP